MSAFEPNISIIIPVLNEADYIAKVLLCIKQNACTNHIKEILVVDGGSTDATPSIAKAHGAKLLYGKKGRAAQMNLGAKEASGAILYFLHVDSLPPKDFDRSIANAVKEGKMAGCFQMRFNSNSRFLKFFAWCTQINHQICRGGDQSLFVDKNLFFDCKGFNEQYTIYEDNEFIQRLYKRVPFTILPSTVTTSARRYAEKGMISLQWHFGVIHLKYYLGARPNELYAYYQKYIAV
ncbi:TIGR04283 family arsenosugar biosynthesis glycosyltransferase [Maribacter confluentis]|uniref:TIGR04283 family arsenosugar biosynthesis glycosyltransferase n=1 Tax=Maribacter confluentis TaxID=1656093 RepID=A0ABT8RN52_9FLAO|nr:TIGR04283 family arsenosugar biosynthesis glycosyltransferase [Maribacter confluentis]MDO1512350.1 TIGR04283 family arsenosugar biosynthesis glycosyltransferase [Maribacter confluentis]